MSWFRKAKPVERTPAEHYALLISAGWRPQEAADRANYHLPDQGGQHDLSTAYCPAGVCTPTRNNMITGYTPDEEYFDRQWHEAHDGRPNHTPAEEYARLHEWTPDMGLTRDLREQHAREDVEISITRPERHSLPAPETPRLAANVTQDEREPWQIGHWVMMPDGCEIYVED